MRNHFDRGAGFGARSAFEGLEPRLVLAAAVWDGGPSGTGTDWHDAANWVGDVLPMDGDDVTIAVAADPQITYTSGTLNLASLTTSEHLRVSGGELGVSGAADIDATLSLQGGTISGGSWDVTGGVLQPLASGGNRILNASVVGDITLDQSNGRVQIDGTTSWTGVARLAASTTTLGFAGGSSLPGDVRVEGSGTGTRALTLLSSGTFTIPSGRSVTSAVGFAGSVQIGGNHHWGGVMDLVMAGTIDVTSSLASRVLSVQGATTVSSGDISGDTITVRLDNAFTNTGVISVENGAVDFDDDWDNSGGVVSLTDSDLELGGSFTTAGLGTINRVGTTSVTLSGALDNSGDSLGFDASSGSWVLLGGSVTGGQMTSADGERLRIGSNSNNRLVDVAIVGDLVVDQSSGRVRIEGTTAWTGLARLEASTTTLGFAGGSSLPGDVSVEGAATGTRALTLFTAGAFTVPAGRTIGSGGGFAGNLQIGGSHHWGQAMDLVVEGTVDVMSSTTARSLTFAAPTMVNTGAISGDTITVRFNGAFTNTGAVSADDAAIGLGGAWDNSGGVITLANSDLELGGSFTTAGIGTINRVGTTTITLSGALDNSGDSLGFDASSGSWVLLGGSVTGGQMTSADGERLRIGSNSNNRLVDVAIVGDLVIDQSSGRVRIEGTTTWTGTARLAASSTTLGFAGGSGLPGDVVLEGGGTGNRALTLFSAGTFTIPAGVAVYSDAGYGGMGQLGGSHHWGAAMTLVNDGTIEFTSLVGRTMTVGAAGFENNGSVTVHTALLRLSNGFVNNGAITGNLGDLEFDGAWDNSAGIVNVLGATLELDGSFTTAAVGTITRAGASKIELTGDLDNTGDTLAFDAATGSWELAGGTVTGGTLSHADGERLAIGLNSNSMLVDVSVVGGLLLDIGGGRVQIRGSTTWDVARMSAGGTSMGFEAGASVPGDVVIEGVSTTRALTLISDGVLTVPAGVSVSSDGASQAEVQIGGSYYWSGVMGLVVEGSVRLGNTNGAPLRIIAETVTVGATGEVGSTGSTVQLRPASAVLESDGTLSAHDGGRLLVDLDGAAFVNAAMITAGPGSRVEFAGDLTLASTSVLRLEINGYGAGDIGFLLVGGTLTLGGTISVAGVDGWTPECVLVDCINAGTLAGAFDTLDLPVTPEGHKSFLIFGLDGQTIRFAVSPESDWNSDGVLDTLDFLAFLNDWVADDPRADFNGDGRIDTLDFLAFLNSWTTGCDG